MATIKAVFYLPIRDNDGRSLQDEIDAVELDCYLAFDGWTLQGEVRGTYRMPDGSQSRDVCSAYSIVLDESRLDELKEILRAFRRKTNQEAIYLEIQRDIDIEFLR